MIASSTLWGLLRGRLNYDFHDGVSSSFLVAAKTDRLVVGAYQYYAAIDPKKGTHIGDIRRLMFLDPYTKEPVDGLAETRLERAKKIPNPGWVRIRIPASHWETRLEGLFTKYDLILPAFDVGALPSVVLKAAARGLLQDLSEMSPGRDGYYRALAPEFFTWLDELVQ